MDEWEGVTKDEFEEIKADIAQMSAEISSLEDIIKKLQKELDALNRPWAVL